MCFTVPPRVSTISFLGDTRAGMRTQATCFVQAGDQPISIKWLKDGQSIGHHLDVKINQIDAFTSMLTIDSLSGLHSGNYSCEASNSARNAVSTARLSVSGMHL